MGLRLGDRWLWDFWFAVDGDDVHVFYLQAPRALGDPELRHRNATVGHAVSRDLRSWRVLPDALGPAPPGAFDDLATWTGSVVRAGEVWHMLHSGISRAEDGAVQRIGLATSPDLVTWTRHGAVLEADPRWYATLADAGDDGARGEQHWRDPWVFRDAERGGWSMLLTARARHGPADARGVIGQAWSPDLRSWTAGPPVSEPGEFHQLEVPQLLWLGGRWHVLFCVGPGDHGAARRARRGGAAAEWGTHHLVGDAPLGPFALSTDDFLLGEPHGRHYAGRAIEHRGAWYVLAWLLHDERGAFVGELSDPMPLHAEADGSLRVHAGERRGGSRA
jgi:beta-fructofuranosidase